MNFTLNIKIDKIKQAQCAKDGSELKNIKINYLHSSVTAKMSIR